MYTREDLEKLDRDQLIEIILAEVKPSVIDQASELLNQAGEAVADAAQTTRDTVTGLITRITG